MLRLGESVHYTATEFGGAILDERAGQYWKLNTVSAFLVEHLRDGSTEDELIHAVELNFEVKREAVARDVCSFLTEMSARGLLE